MNDSQTKVALNWVKDEIESTLEQAQTAIGAFSENESDKTQIHFCSNCMHQITGTMKMLQFDGAALLSAEMEALVEDIGEDKVASKEQAYEVFLDAVLHFKSYLARYADDKDDLPLILMPIINDMRTCRKLELLTAGNMLNIELNTVEPMMAEEALNFEGDIQREVKDIRSTYQQSLTGYIRNQDVEQNVQVMQGLIKKLWQLGPRVPYPALWWVSSVLLKQIADGQLQDNISVKGLFGKLDRQIKDLIEQRIDQSRADTLLSNLLFYVAHLDNNDPQVQQIQEKYHLKELLLQLGDYKKETEELASTDSESIKMALRVIKEDLAEIKESLDLYIRTQSSDHDALEELLPIMQKIGATMGILNLSKSQALVQEQVYSINALINDQVEDKQQELISIVEAVLKLDDHIDRSMLQTGQQLSEDLSDTLQHDSLQVLNARYQLIQESRITLKKVKDAMNDYLEEDHRVARLEMVPSLLKEVEGALEFSQLEMLRDVVSKMGSFVGTFLIGQNVVLSENETANLADTLSSVDYYLEGLLSSGLHGLPSVLKKAVDSISALEEHYVEIQQEEVPMLDDAINMPEIELIEQEQSIESDSLIDDELREIFVEEADEVLAELKDAVPSWREDQGQSELLLTIRRNYHTLKGSGRMVEAKEIGELGWAIEDMLNRLIDGTIDYSPALGVTLEEATSLLPQMIKSFEKGTRPELPQELIDRANLISKGEIITDELVQSIEIEPEVIAEPELTPEQELFDIFKQEAEGHVVSLEMFSNQKVQGITQCHISDNLLRSLHTLKGVAHVSGIESLKQVIIPVESYFQELKSRELMADEADMSLIADTKDLLKHIIELPEDRVAHEAHEQEILTQISALQMRFNEALETTEDTGRDPELLKDLFNIAADVLADLEAIRLSDVAEEQRRDKVSYLMASNDRLDSIVHTADIPEVSEITTAVGQALQRNMSSLVIDTSFDDLLVKAHYRLENQFDCLAANLSVDTAPELVSEINAWSPAEVVAEEISVDETIELTLDDEFLTDESTAIELSESDEAKGLGEAILSDDLDLTDLVENLSNDGSIEFTPETDQYSEPAQDATEEALAEGLSEEIAELKDIELILDVDSRTPELSETTEEVAEEVAEEELDIDEELLEIFIEEADEIFHEDGQLLAKWAQEPTDLSKLTVLQRNLHTLKGSAKMAGFAEIGDLAHELEDLYTALVDKIFEPDQKSVQAAQTAEDYLLSMFIARKKGHSALNGEKAIQAIHQFIESAKAGHPEIDESPQDTADVDKVAETDQSVITEDKIVSKDDSLWDEGLAQEFLSEADELLAGLDESIDRWSNNMTNVDRLSPAVRSLHTLKGGARLSMLPSVANLAEKGEKFAKLLARDGRVGQTRWKDLLTNVHRQLQVMITEVRSGGLPREAYNLMAKLDDNISMVSNQLDQLARREEITPDEQVNINVIPLAERQKQKEQLEKEAESRDVIRVRSDVLDNLVNLSGEASILRARLEQQTTDINFHLNEVGSTIDRLRVQLRNMEIETEAQVLYRREVAGVDLDDFDPLEMDRYTRQQELTRSLLEAASDLTSLQESLHVKLGDTDASLLQQSRINTELQERLMRTRMVPFDSIESRLNRMVRTISSELGKKIDLHLQSEGEMDRTVIERMVAPLEHMLRNAIDHGIESVEERKRLGKKAAGSIHLSLKRRGNEVFIQLKDDGAGIRKDRVKARAVAQGMIDKSYQPTDRELFRLILQAGFSTAEEVTQISGRGVGLDVVNSEIMQLGGSLAIQSQQGEGTTMTIRLPFTLSSNQSLLVKVKGENYAIPLSNITNVIRVPAEQVREIYQSSKKKFEHLGESFELRYLGQILDRNSKFITPFEDMVQVLIIEGEDKPIAVHVDELLGSREVVVKSVGRQLSTVPGISGASIFGDGSVVLILDMQTLVDRFHEWDFSQDTQLIEEVVTEDKVPTIMVVDDSITVRKVTSRFLQRNQFKVETAKDGVDALTQLNEIIPDVMLLDIEMPRMDGFELANLIRHDSRLKNIPIIMITSRTGEKHRQRAEEIGVNDYLGKPYNEEILISTINKMLEQEL